MSFFPRLKTVFSISAKWSGDRTGQYSKTGSLINTILSVLEDLDGYVFDRLDSANCLDSLYSRLFDQVFENSLRGLKWATRKSTKK